MGDMVPFDHSLRPDEPQFVCLGCDGEFSRRSAPNPVYVLDFVFHDIECWPLEEPRNVGHDLRVLDHCETARVGCSLRAGMDADDAIARAEIARKYVREAIEQSKRLRDSVEGRQFPPVPWNRALNLPKRPKRSTRR